VTKKEYLHQLEAEIILLDEDIADDIIEYYKLRFEEGKRFENKTVLEIIEDLGDPKDLAKRIYSSYDIREDLWESARDEKVNLFKAVSVLVFDILVGTWLVPLLVFLTLTGFASFVTFPFVIAALPGLVIKDAFLVILLALGTYSILLLLVLGLAEVGIVVIKNILIWNLKVLTPKNKTTARMIKRLSLFQWMRQIKMGRNIFINLGMVAITLVSVSFILLSNFNSDVFGAFNTRSDIVKTYERDLSHEIESGDEYTIIANIGDVDIRFVTNLTNELQITHKYNLNDGFTYDVDFEKNMIYINTFQDKVSDGFINTYTASILVSIPEGLIVSKVDVDLIDGDVDVLKFISDEFNVKNHYGDIHLYNLLTSRSEIISSEGTITIIAGQYDLLTIVSTDSYITVNDINNMLNDGSKLSINTIQGVVNLTNIYFEELTVDTLKADVFVSNDNEVYVINKLEIVSDEGVVVIDAPYLQD